MKGLIDHTSTDRNYLFGRLMAIHEYTAFCAEGDDIQTLRMYNRYVAHPMTTFAKIESELMPGMYLKLSAKVYDKVMDTKAEIMSLMPENGYNNDPLEPAYLIGYHMQREAIKKQAQNKE